MNFTSVKLKSIPARKLVDGDIVMFGSRKCGAFHKITKMRGLIQHKKTLRMDYDSKFHSLIRDKKIIPTSNSNKTKLSFSRYPDTIVKIIHFPLTKV
jgi:hypothetical protein